MKTKLYLSLFFVIIMLAFSCKKKSDEPSTDPALDLDFSMDTVIFDTVFTQVLTATKRLRITNNAKNAVNIDHIYVNPDSPYSLIINGEETNDIQNMFLRGGDSFLILVKAVLGKNNSAGAYVVEDSIQFMTNTNQQSVNLVSWGRDAVFHSREGICDEIWTAEKPHIIYDFVLVNPGCKLTIEAGAEVYVHGGGPFNLSFLDNNDNAILIPTFGPGMIIAGTLIINGTANNRVTITDDRLEDKYEHRPGMWGELQFLNTAVNCEINYCDISNAANGIRIGKEDDDNNPDIIIRNSTIRDMRYHGIHSYTADINIENSVVTNCAQYSVALLAGGTHNINHCTFAEYDFEFTRNDKVSSLRVSNYEEFSNGTSIGGDLNFNMSNSIVWGNKGTSDDIEEVQLPPSGGGNLYEVDFSNNNIIKTTNEDILSSSNTNNVDPQFITKDSVSTFYDFKLMPNSPAINSGVGSVVLDDVFGVFRNDGKPDIGAHEFQP